MINDVKFSLIFFFILLIKVMLYNYKKCVKVTIFGDFLFINYKKPQLITLTLLLYLEIDYRLDKKKFNLSISSKI